MALDDPAQFRIDDGRVQRMRHLANEAANRVARQAGVRIQGDHVAHVGRQRARGQKTGVGRATQQTVQFMQLAALAFPTHPTGLARVPDPATMQHDEAVAADPGADVSGR